MSVYYSELYSSPALGPAEVEGVRRRFARRFGEAAELLGVESEYCYRIEHECKVEGEKLRWILSARERSEWGEVGLEREGSELVGSVVACFRPRGSFRPAWSTTAMQILEQSKVGGVRGIERRRRVMLRVRSGMGEEELRGGLEGLFGEIQDRMLECREGEEGVAERPATAGEWGRVRWMEEGEEAVRRVGEELGLWFDRWDMEYYRRLFCEELRRNPTTVELFDLSQSNSEHARHWFFKGVLRIGGEEMGRSLMELVSETLERNRTNSLVAYSDNASVVRGFRTVVCEPSEGGRASRVEERSAEYDVTFTAETHNFPTGVAPYPGAETGVGGRIRDGHAVGRGSVVVGGTAGYAVGQLRVPGYELEWEEGGWGYPGNVASPLEVLIGASNGASDYANRFGEPLIAGYARAFGAVARGERREYVKPIMFSGGLGQIERGALRKGEVRSGMLVVKIGGPAYRIGIGGGAASSQVHGENREELDFNAVQRGDAEMEQRVDRVVRACARMGRRNPIVSIHDQGSGGNANVLKELVGALGARIEVDRFPLGDETLSTLEIWCAEYQENDAVLIEPESEELFASICERERCPYACVGRVSGDGRVVLVERGRERDEEQPYCLPQEKVLGGMPRKVFESEAFSPLRWPLSVPAELEVGRALRELVLPHVEVGSKRFLTSKVDRSVTGLVVQQPCVGPLHVPVADCGIVSQGYVAATGSVTSIGEQPVKGLLCPAAMARVTVGEAMTNLCCAYVSGGSRNVKASANWMWPAKLPGEAAAIYEACSAMSAVMCELGLAVDGGKDSLTMAAKLPGGEVVKCPGTLVVSLYAPMEDVNLHVSPNIRRPGESSLVFVDMSLGRNRLGGSALARGLKQLGDAPPDMDNPDLFLKMWNFVQSAVLSGLALSGHDRSDGGLLVTLLEMAISGHCGLQLRLPPYPGSTYVDRVLAPLFSEELGVVLEVPTPSLPLLLDHLPLHGVPTQHLHVLGSTTLDKRILLLDSDGSPLLDSDLLDLWSSWERTSFQLERLQCRLESVLQEEDLSLRHPPSYSLSFDPWHPLLTLSPSPRNPKVAIIREEGSNGDREMAAAFLASHFEPWDVNMHDLVHRRVSLDMFKGCVFVGGFSYGDVAGSAKGWASVIKYNQHVHQQLNHFIKNRQDTFTLGVCNGCQLLSILGVTPFPQQPLPDSHQPHFSPNDSGRFESRFPSVRILPSPSIFLRGMAGSVLGIWTAHAEGKLTFPNQLVEQTVLDRGLAPIRYVDDSGRVTQQYPLNPNGSPHGIAALCSEDGRHLSMMPHCERSFLLRQWPWIPEPWRSSSNGQLYSPWKKLFDNAHAWATSSL